jgi:hypothetical protein
MDALRCSTSSERKHGRLQIQRRKYVFTAQIDQRIREIYFHHPNAKSTQVFGNWRIRSRFRTGRSKSELANLAWREPKRGRGVNRNWRFSHGTHG